MSNPEKCNDQWTDYQVPTVEEDGNAPFRYWVESAGTVDRRYLADLTANDGLGRCSCVHFHMVCEPNQRRLGYRIPYAKGRQGMTDCKHLDAARAFYFEHTERQMFCAFRHGITERFTTIPNLEDFD